MGVKLVSASAGSVEIVAPATASNYTATMPAGTGTVVINGVNSALISGTAVASTSGTSIDFTSIPSWVKRITVMFNGVSTNGTSDVQIQLGAGSVTTSGYASSNSSGAAGVATASATTGHLACTQVSATNLFNGHVVFTNISSNIWVGSGLLMATGTTGFNISGSTVTLSGTLDRLRVTTVVGTDTFDAGSINILYE